MPYKLITNDIQHGRLPREVAFPGRENDDQMCFELYLLMCSDE